MGFVWAFVVLWVAMIVFGVRASGQRKREMTNWAERNGGFASGNSVTKRIEFGVLEIFRDTGDETSSATTVFTVYPDRPCIPFSVTVKDFRKGSAFGAVGADPAIQSLMSQWKSGLLEARATNRKEQKCTPRPCVVILRVNEFLPAHELGAGIRIIERALQISTTT